MTLVKIQIICIRLQVKMFCIIVDEPEYSLKIRAPA
uniref:Uncharacterized protein n=1 Tax=Triticum urartu TaxID=4572 RepID=A0A8R7QAD8_TRIUA